MGVQVSEFAQASALKVSNSYFFKGKRVAVLKFPSWFSVTLHHIKVCNCVFVCTEVYISRHTNRPRALSVNILLDIGSFISLAVCKVVILFVLKDDAQLSADPLDPELVSNPRWSSLSAPICFIFRVRGHICRTVIIYEPYISGLIAFGLLSCSRHQSKLFVGYVCLLHLTWTKWNTNGFVDSAAGNCHLLRRD